MEGKLIIDFISTIQPERISSSLPGTVSREKQRVTANGLCSICTEEVAALVIDNGYVSPRPPDTQSHQFFLRGRCR